MYYVLYATSAGGDIKICGGTVPHNRKSTSSGLPSRVSREVVTAKIESAGIEEVLYRYYILLFRIEKIQNYVKKVMLPRIPTRRSGLPSRG